MLDDDGDHTILTAGGRAHAGLNTVSPGPSPGTFLSLHDTR